MATSQPFTVACDGGLINSSNAIDLLRTPGVARELLNFEVSTEGGYRRINGYQKFGTTSSTQPTSGTTDILGVVPYADGVIVCASTNIYFTQDGITYLQLNRASVSGSGDNYSTFTGRSVAARSSQGQCTFALFEGNTDYGEVVICDGAMNLFFLK